MYNQIDNNRRKTYLIVAVFMAVMLTLGWIFSYLFNSYVFLIIAFAIAVVQVWFSYYHGDTLALAVSHAQAVTKDQAPDLYRIVENLTMTAGLPMPKIYITPDPAPNAFATGRDKDHASLAVTEGLLNRLNKTELEGVIAHELSHIGNRDILVMSVTMVLVGAIVMLSDFFLRSLWFRSDNNRNSEGSSWLLIIGIILAILSPLIASLLQLAVSRKREYMADASGALLTRYPQGLAEALKKISHWQGEDSNINRATEMLYIENPLQKQNNFLSNLFSTHPPVEDRIKRLEAMA